jgi:hypothetical protein
MKLFLWMGPAILAIGVGSLSGQSTTIDLTRQARLESGSQLPQHCGTGQLFIKSTAPNGASLYLCTSTDSWSAVGVPLLGGDAAGTPLAVTVQGLQGRGIATTTPADGNVLRWNDGAGKWQPAQADSLSAGSGMAIAGSIISIEDAVVPAYYAGTGFPTIDCVTGRDFYVDTQGGGLYFCKGTNSWQPVSLPGHTHAAGDIATGTLAAGRLPAAVVLTGQANAFGAGQRQSVSHDGSNAGLQITPAAGDPASPQNGDIWYNSSAGKFRRYQNGSAMDWDISGAALTAQANLFAAGKRQSVGHDSLSAGLRLVPGAGDPSSLQDGDVWYNVTTGKFRRRQNGATVDWDTAAGGISTSQANTYTAGQKQSMGHDSLSAGLRLIPAAGDPSTLQDGDVWYNVTAGKFRRRQNGTTVDWDATVSGSQGFDPHDTGMAGARPALRQAAGVWRTTAVLRTR